MNGKLYIGQTTKSAEERWSQHVRSARNKVHTRLYGAIRKYGVESFEIKVMAACSSQEELNRREIELIKQLQTMNNDKGYNSHPGGSPSKGYKPSEEQRIRMSEAMKRKWQDPEFVARKTSSKTSSPQAKCHPDRPALAVGLCKTCYNREWYRRKNRSGPRPKHSILCHPDRPRRAKGLCGSCYVTSRTNAAREISVTAAIS